MTDPLVPGAVLGHVRNWNALYGPFPGTDTALCGDETVIPGGGDCGPSRCVKTVGHARPITTDGDPEADHKCACGGRWDLYDPATDPTSGR